MSIETGNFGSLRQWAESNGFKIHKNVDLIKDQYGSNKAIATEDITDSQVLIECPEPFFFGPKIARKLFGKIPDGKAVQVYTRMAFLHEFHKQDQSPWWPYFQQLPQTAKEIHPIFYDEKCIELIQETNLSSELPEKMHLWKTEFDKFLINHPEMKYITEQEYMWANAIFTSRSFPASVAYPDENEFATMLIPLVDFLNHRPLYPVEWNAVGGGRFQIINSSKITKGKEIFNNYGPKGNEELLLAYGFCIDNNPFDNVPLKIAVSPLVSDYCKEKNVQLPEDGIFFLENSDKAPVPKTLIDVFAATACRKDAYVFGSLISQLAGIEMLRTALKAKSDRVTKRTKPFDIKDQNQQYSCWYTKGVRRIYEFSLEFCRKQMETILNSENILVLDTNRMDRRILQAGLKFLHAESIIEVIDSEDDVLFMELATIILSNKEPRIKLEQASEKEKENYKFYYDEWTGILSEFSGPEWTLQRLAEIGKTFESQVLFLPYDDDHGRSRIRAVIEFDSQ